MTGKTLIGGGLLALTAAVVLAGCGGNDSSGGHDMGDSSAAASDQQAEHNQADVAFAQQMIPHHSQAIDMATLATDRTTNATVLDLATRIERAQGPEIETMTGWLEERGAPATPSDSMSDMDHGATMPGAMTDEDLMGLEQAKDAAFDVLFLQLMIQHHQGAIVMATTELNDGLNADAKALAQDIVDAQQAEITEMQALLPQG